MEILLRPATMSAERLWHSLTLLPHYRDLFWVLTLHRIKVRYRQAALGPLWAVLQPLGMMIIVTAMFSFIAARAPSNGHPYAVFAYAGLLAWTAFASALASGSGSLVSHAALLTRVSFPREILPLTYVAAALFDLLVASSVLVLLLAYYDIALTSAVVWVIPALVVLAALATTASLVLSAVNVRYRDIGVAMPLLLQFWMFASPVIYPLSAVPDEFRRWYVLNPMAGIVDTFRRATLDGQSPDMSAFGPAIVVTAILLPLAYLWFKHVDATLADQV